MTKYELINQNKALKAEKNRLHDRLHELKGQLEPLYILARRDESHIRDLTNDIEHNKAWIRSETQSLDNIKRKLSKEHNTLNYLNDKLKSLYDDKSYAYNCKNYDRIGSIKADIENIKRQKEEVRARIDSIKRDRDRQSAHISDMIDANKSRHEKRSRYYDTKNKYFARIYVLREEQNEIRERLTSIKKQIEENNYKISLL